MLHDLIVLELRVEALKQSFLVLLQEQGLGCGVRKRGIGESY